MDAGYAELREFGFIGVQLLEPGLQILPLEDPQIAVALCRRKIPANQAISRTRIPPRRIRPEPSV